MSDVRQRFKVAGGRILPEHPEDCEPHTPAPEGYAARMEWMEEMAVTHVQCQCHGCGLWAVWEPKEEAADG